MPQLCRRFHLRFGHAITKPDCPMLSGSPLPRRWTEGLIERLRAAPRDHMEPPVRAGVAGVLGALDMCVGFELAAYSQTNSTTCWESVVAQNDGRRQATPAENSPVAPVNRQP